MDDLNAVTTTEVNDAQVANVEPQEPAVSDGDNQQPTVAQEPAKPVQTAEQNKMFAEMRRRAEAEVKKQYEPKLAQAERERDALYGALQKFNYNGTPTEIAEILAAQQAQIPVEQYREIAAYEQEKIKQGLMNSPEYAEIREELEFRRQADFERIRTDDLAAIKTAFPEVKAGSVDELGEEFFKLRANGISATVAYAAIKASKKSVPPEIGAVNNVSGQEKEFFTDKELDKLTKTDLNDPKIFEKAFKSMNRLGVKN